MDGDLVAIQPDQCHLPQPRAVFHLAKFLLQTPAHARPLGGKLWYFHDFLLHGRGHSVLPCKRFFLSPLTQDLRDH